MTAVCLSLAGLLLTTAAFAQTLPRPPASQAPPSSPAGGSAKRPARAASAAGRGAPAVPSYKDLKFEPLRAYEPPKMGRIQLTNGLRVLLIENHETPVVNITAVARGGSVFDPPDRAGLALVTGTLLRQGGAARRTPDRVDADLDALGATLESSIGETSASVTMTVFRETLGEALALFKSVLTEPSFRQDRVDLARATLINSISRRNDDPRELLGRELQALVYGSESVFGRRPEYASVSRITRGDVVAFYRRHFFPANVVLAVSGDFDGAQMADSLESLFGSWENNQARVADPPKEVKPSHGGFVAVKPGLREAWFAAGHLGGEFLDKDGAAAEVAAAALGLSSQSRLVQRGQQAGGALREIHADWRAGFGVPGLFLVQGSGRPQDTGENVRMVLEEIGKLRSSEITEEELRAAREAVLARFSAGLDNPARTLAMAVNLECYGYPPDAVAQYQKAVAAVTRADVLRAARERIDPSRFSVIAVSSLNEFTRPLNPAGGPDTRVDLAIPPPPARSSAGGSLEQGKQMLARVQQAVGGVDRLAAVRDFTQTATYRLVDGGTESQTDRWIPPAHLRQDAQSSLTGPLYRYTDGTVGWLSNGRGSVGLSGVQARHAREDTVRAYISLLLSDRVSGRVVSALDEETIEIAQGDLVCRLVIDRNTSLPSKLLYELQMEQRPLAFVEEALSDFREVNGIKLPFAIGVFHNGVKYSEGVVSEYKFNQGLKPEILQRRP